MSITVDKTLRDVQSVSIFHAAHNQISRYFERRRTIAALAACTPHQLQDAGLIAQDIVVLARDHSADADERLSRAARSRSGNW